MKTSTCRNTTLEKTIKLHTTILSYYSYILCHFANYMPCVCCVHIYKVVEQVVKGWYIDVHWRVSCVVKGCNYILSSADIGLVALYTCRTLGVSSVSALYVVMHSFSWCEWANVHDFVAFQVGRNKLDQLPIFVTCLSGTLAIRLSSKVNSPLVHGKDPYGS